MEPGIQDPLAESQRSPDSVGQPGPHGAGKINPGAAEFPGLIWVFIGDGGLRVGWSLLIFAILFRLFNFLIGTVAVELDPSLAWSAFSARIAFIAELIPLLALVGAGALVARLEGRTILDYNLNGPRRSLQFFAGMVAGFAALSALVGALALGGWLHFGPSTLAWYAVFKYAALWGAAFLLVGFFEEGTFRCYLQFTLARGINFWLALGIVGLLCLDLLLRSSGHPGLLALVLIQMPGVKGSGPLGVYAIALLGIAPCLLLHLKKAAGSGFWQAAWVSSAVFGYIHTGNGGENWIGIFAAAAIGFVFCVSVRVTGSAWWAIGFHAAWDWAESFFYGTADSGMVAPGHFLATSPAGNALWSGGADGPEGSLLVLAVIVLLLVALAAVYRRRKYVAPAAAHRA
jgi:hypothetical protein